MNRAQRDRSEAMLRDLAEVLAGELRDTGGRSAMVHVMRADGRMVLRANLYGGDQQTLNPAVSVREVMMGG